MVVAFDLFFSLNVFVYRFVKYVYDAFIMLAEFNLFDNEDLIGFASRLYSIIAIVMIFKLAFNFMKIVIDPEKSTTTKTNDGISSLISRIVLSIGMLLIMPFMFILLTRIQGAILNNNVIPQLITGEAVDSSNAGNSLTGSLILTFVKKNTEGFSSSGDLEKIDRNYGELRTALSPKEEKENPNYENAKNIILDGKREGNLISVVGINFLEIRKYYLNFEWLLCLIVGMITLLIIASSLVDMGVRCVKLAFLQLIAPIPVLMYVDEKTKSSTMSFVKEYAKTYAEVFIKVLAFSFMAYGISLVTSEAFVNKLEGKSPVLLVLLLLGFLMFMKEIGNIIGAIFGFTPSGGAFSLNPFSSIGSVPFLGAATLGAGALALGGARGGLGGLASGFTSGISRAANSGGGFFSRAGGAVAGAVKGAVGGTTAGVGTASSNVWNNFKSGKIVLSGSKSNSKIIGGAFKSTKGAGAKKVQRMNDRSDARGEERAEAENHTIFDREINNQITEDNTRLQSERDNQITFEEDALDLHNENQHFSDSISEVNTEIDELNDRIYSTNDDEEYNMLVDEMDGLYESRNILSDSMDSNSTRIDNLENQSRDSEYIAKNLEENVDVNNQRKDNYRPGDQA